MRLMFVKETSMPIPVKSLGYVTCHSSSSSRPVKGPAVVCHATVRRSGADQKDLKPYWNQQKGHISLDDQQSYYIQVFFKDFTNHRNKANRVTVFSCKPFSNILKYKDPR